MKKLLLFLALLLISISSALPAQAQDGPQVMTVSCEHPKPAAQNGLKRPIADGNMWAFTVSLAGGRWVSGPFWSYPGKGGGDPDWGQWYDGNDGDTSVSWNNPQKAGNFHIKVTGQIACGNGGDGGPIDIEADWFGDVEAKEWEAEPDIEGGVLVKPQNQVINPATPTVVLVKTDSEVDCEVTQATDKDKWTSGEDEGEEDDTVKYKWTASGGGFVTAANPMGDAPFAETRAAKWKTPTEPGDYTLECTIDDLPKELDEDETGTRDDEEAKRTLQVKVVKMKFVPHSIRLYVGDTKDVDVLITPEEVCTLFTFSMLDTSVATHSGAPVTFTITGVAAGNTKFQAKYNNTVFDQATVIVKEHIDEETDDLDDDGIADIFDDDIDGDGVIDNTPAKLWSPDTGITGGEFAASEVTVPAGGTVGLEVSQASDTDKWRKGTDSGHESDTVHYDWSGGNVTANSAEPWKSTYTAPSQSGEYYVRVKIDDEPAAVTAPDRGNRDDSAITRTIKVIVTQKKWKAQPAISGGEVTQPADTDEENPKEIGPGETVDLAVSEATDQDTWTQGADTDQEADTVHYKWTSSDGGFVTDDHPEGDATEVKERTALWKAPEEPGDYTITCEIDDEPAAVEDPDTGDRDDDPLTRTVHIKVEVGESSATLKLYKDAELTEEATGTIGGNVYVVLEVKLGKYQKLASSSATLRIEENYQEHSEAERRWDREVDFADGWQKKNANGEWQPTPATPQTKNSSGDDEYFRKVWSWPTYSQPLGHNEQHTVEIVKVDGGEDTELSFTPTSEGDDGKDGPESVNVDVANLVITDVTTNTDSPDYFKFDPDSEDSTYKTPTLGFTIKDEGDPHQYKWTVKVRSTSVEDQEWTVFARGQVPSAQEVSIKLNDPESPNTQEGQLIYRGTFAFDIEVEEYDDLNIQNPPMLDSQTLRSLYLSVPPTYDGGKPGHNFYNEWVGSDLHAKLDYYITDTQNKDASKVHVDFLNPEWDVKASSDLSTTINTPHENIDLYTYSGDVMSGYYKALLTAKDDHGAQYRDHENRWMPAVNGFERNLTIEWIDVNESLYTNLGANSINIIWIKKSQLGWTSKKKIQVAALNPETSSIDADAALPTVKEHVWQSLLNASGFSTGFPLAVGSPSVPAQGTVDFTMRAKKGTIWGATNGTYYKTERPPNFPLSGDIGINGAWSSYDATRSVGADSSKWSFGVSGGGLEIARMSDSITVQNEANVRWFSSPPVKGYNYGLGGVGCLIKGGEEVPKAMIFPLKNGGISDNTSSPYGRIILAWTEGGEHVFMIRLQGQGSGLPGATGWTGIQAQAFLTGHLPTIISKYTDPKDKGHGLQISIHGAVLLDGGTHGQIVYAWNDTTGKDTWNGNPAINPASLLQDMYDEKHDFTADNDHAYSNGRGTRSAVEAFDLP